MANNNVNLGPVEDIANTLSIASKPKEFIDNDSNFDNIATGIVNLAPIDLNSIKLDEFLLRNLKPAALPIFKRLVEQYTNLGVEYMTQLFKDIGIDLEDENGEIITSLTPQNQDKINVMAKIIFNTYSNLIKDPKFQKEYDETLQLAQQFIQKLEQAILVTLVEAKQGISKNINDFKPITKELLVAGISTVMQAIITALATTGPIGAIINIPNTISRASNRNVPKIVNFVDKLGEKIKLFSDKIEGVDDTVNDTIKPLLELNAKLNRFNEILKPMNPEIEKLSEQ
tara:strand:+ start:3163 stop:4017 length:855 start_codon:yes stop_codon:yes gene_type:complete